MPGDDDLLAPLDLFEQAREVRRELENMGRAQAGRRKSPFGTISKNQSFLQKCSAT
jgi:hypothetical protein